MTEYLAFAVSDQETRYIFVQAGGQFFIYPGETIMISPVNRIQRLRVIGNKEAAIFTYDSGAEVTFDLEHDPAGRISLFCKRFITHAKRDSTGFRLTLLPNLNISGPKMAIIDLSEILLFPPPARGTVVSSMSIPPTISLEQVKSPEPQNWLKRGFQKLIGGTGQYTKYKGEILPIYRFRAVLGRSSGNKMKFRDIILEFAKSFDFT